MTKLEICQRTQKECVKGTPMATTIAQSGILGDIVDWVDSAYEEIQSKHQQWRFLRDNFSFSTYQKLDFDAGTAAISAGDTVTQTPSGATGVAAYDATVESGAYSTNDAAGFLGLTGVTGTFVDNQALQVSAVTKSVADGTAAFTAIYPPTSVGLPEHADWRNHSFRLWLTTAGQDDEQWIDYWQWGLFRDVHLIASQVTTPGRPIDFSVQPDRSVNLWPIPDAIYTVVGEYWKRAAVMAADTDEPLFPERFHMAIVWLAKMYFADDQETSMGRATAQRKYGRLLFSLENNQLIMSGKLV